MAQCLMGHGIAAYTTDLSVKYRKPVLIDTPVTLTTKIECVKCNVLYSIKCEMVQKYNIVVQGTGRFYKINR
jgi:acyl-CoA thioesterase FadM